MTYEKARKTSTLAKLILLAIIGLFAILPSILDPTKAKAAWDAGRIIDDSVFYNKSAMNQDQIQKFLNAKVPDCDNWGEKLHSSGKTRAQWARDNGKPEPPYYCLKGKNFNVNSKSGDEFCNGLGGGTKKAARIINEVAKSCGVNPKALIVLLQKEQSLVTDDWPWPIQYRSATGYGCPDTAPCDSQYYGFPNQVFRAARQFRVYRQYPHSYNHIPGTTNNVRFHPNSSCGSSSVFIQNQATAGLYNYTPYQPNQAALNAGWGTGNSCSSYGNRNFWKYFRSWFGSTRGGTSYKWRPAEQALYADSARTEKLPYTAKLEPGQKVYGRIRAKNTGNQVWYDSFMRLATHNPRDRASAFRDADWISKNRVTNMSQETVGPGEVATFDFTITAPDKTGSYREYYSLVAESIEWLNNPGLYFPIKVIDSRDFNFYLDSKRNKQIDDNPTVYRGSTIYVTATILNNTSSAFPSNTRLATTSPLDRTSVFRDSSWISNNRVGNLGKVVNPGEFGNFNFTMTVPDQINSWPESFGLVVDGTGWIETDSLTATITSKEEPDNVLVFRNDLKSGEFIRSKNGKYKLVMQNDGNLVLYSPKGAVWASNTARTKGNRVRLQSDGNFVLRSSSNKALWASRKTAKTAAYIDLQNDGNLVIRGAMNKALWATDTSGKL